MESRDNQKQEMMRGSASIMFQKPVAILASASIAGTKESKGPFGSLFDLCSDDTEDLFQGKTWEEAESNMQKLAVETVLRKKRLTPENIRYLFCGDLLGQDIATSFGVMDFEIPLWGLFGACSTSGEALALGAAFVSAGYAEKVVSLTSSHFASAEKEFRFPLGYGGQRPPSASWTVTGSGAFVLGNVEQDTKAVVTAITPGKIVDYGIKDSFNMGCAMAPAAAATIGNHLKDMGRKPDDYDAIVTGDLGLIGSRALIDMLGQEKLDISRQHVDCGAEIFGRETEHKAGMDTHAGGSGCGCAAIMLASVFLPKVESGEWKRILFVPTGALLNKLSFNEGNSVPGIAHAVVIEHYK